MSKLCDFSDGTLVAQQPTWSAGFDGFGGNVSERFVSGCSAARVAEEHGHAEVSSIQFQRGNNLVAALLSPFYFN